MTTTRTIRADHLGDAHMGRLVSLAGHPPRKLAASYPARLPSGQPVMVLRWDALTESVVMPDAEITIHPKGKP